MIALADLAESSAATCGSRASRTSCSRTSDDVSTRRREARARSACRSTRARCAATRSPAPASRTATSPSPRRSRAWTGSCSCSRSASGRTLDGLRLHLDGCPHACAQHWVGDLGFQGTTVRDEEGQRRQAYDIYLRGSLDRPAAIARPVFRRVPTEELDDAVVGLVGGWVAGRARGRDLPLVLRPHDRRRARLVLAGAREAHASVATELLDDLEAGELSVEFEGEEPEVVLEWAIERFSPTHLDLDRVPDRRRRAAAHGVRDRSDDPHVQRRHRPAAAGDVRADRAMRERYPRLAARPALARRAAPVNAMVKKHGPNLFYRSVENRLLCCQVRKVLPLQQHLAGLDAWITGLRRDQWATRSDIRKVEIDHDHGAIVKLNPLAEWTEDEVWDYVREHELALQRALRQGLHLDRLRAVHAADADGRGPARRPLVVGVERAEGVRHPLRDRDGRARARAARADRRGGR